MKMESDSERGYDRGYNNAEGRGRRATRTTVTREEWMERRGRGGSGWNENVPERSFAAPKY